MVVVLVHVTADSCSLTRAALHEAWMFSVRCNIPTCACITSLAMNECCAALHEPKNAEGTLHLSVPGALLKPCALCNATSAYLGHALLDAQLQHSGNSKQPS